MERSDTGSLEMMTGRRMSIPSIESDLFVFDNQFPRGDFGFRNREFNYYLNYFARSKAFCMPATMKTLRYPETTRESYYSLGKTPEEYESDRRSYEARHPELAPRIGMLRPGDCRYGCRVAYSLFLNVTYTLIDFYEKHRLPFVFALLPGGGFGIDNEVSDHQLRRVAGSGMFRKVIATQNITYGYLLDRRFCAPDQVVFSNGAVTSNTSKAEVDLTRKRYFKKDKDSFDVCFVANKYTPTGEDKGFDIVMQVATRLVRETNDVNFHLVGEWSQELAQYPGLRSRVAVYGKMEVEALKRLYYSMDIFLSPNRASRLYPGNFDGFPLGITAMCHGVVLFVSDPLSQNHFFEDGKDLLIIDESDVDGIVERIMYYRNDFDGLYSISERAQRKAIDNFCIEIQAAKRITVFEHLMTRVTA